MWPPRRPILPQSPSPAGPCFKVSAVDQSTSFALATAWVKVPASEETARLNTVLPSCGGDDRSLVTDIHDGLDPWAAVFGEGRHR